MRNRVVVPGEVDLFWRDGCVLVGFSNLFQPQLIKIMIITAFAVFLAGLVWFGLIWFGLFGLVG